MSGSEQAGALPELPDPEDHSGEAGSAQAFAGTLLKVDELGQLQPNIVLPRPEHGDLSANVAEVNAIARQRSLDQLADWFPDYDFELAAQTSDDRRFTLLALGDELVQRLRGADTVDYLVRCHDLQVGRLRFSHGDRPGGVERPPRVILDRPNVPLDRRNVERIAVGPTVAALRDRWTTIINNADNLDPALNEICEHLERAYGCLVNTNIYISWGQAEGFGPHWDMHDTIIVPVAGTKKWRIFEPAVLSPLRPWVGPEVSHRPVWEGTISPGEALVIPRGWGHEVWGSDDLAVHYTIGINRFLAHQLVQALQLEAGHWPILRADVPYEPRAPVSSYEYSVHDAPDGLAGILADLATPDLVDRAIAAYRARMRIRQFAQITQTWRAIAAEDWSGLGVRLPVPAGLMLLDSTAESATFAFGNRKVEVAAPAIDAFLAVAETVPLHPEQLPPVDAPDGNQALATELVESGVAVVAETGE